MSRNLVRKSFPNAAMTDDFGGPGSVAFKPGHTLGTTEIADASSTQVNSKWKVLSVSIQAYLFIYPPPFGSYFGKLGEVIGAISLDEPFTPSVGANTYTAGHYQKLPTDSSLAGTMYNPSSDSLPPHGDVNSIFNPYTGKPISTTISPTNPLAINPGESFYVGIWITPSLIGQTVAGQTTSVVVLGMSYAIVYDDGT